MECHCLGLWGVGGKPNLLFADCSGLPCGTGLAFHRRLALLFSCSSSKHIKRRPSPDSTRCCRSCDTCSWWHRVCWWRYWHSHSVCSRNCCRLSQWWVTWPSIPPVPTGVVSGRLPDVGHDEASRLTHSDSFTFTSASTADESTSYVYVVISDASSRHSRGSLLVLMPAVDSTPDASVCSLASGVSSGSVMHTLIQSVWKADRSLVRHCSSTVSNGWLRYDVGWESNDMPGKHTDTHTHTHTHTYNGLRSEICHVHTNQQWLLHITGYCLCPWADKAA